MSINHYGEELCGDHVDVVEQSDDSTVIVLADGLGSGVKASILSTHTSKIISTIDCRRGFLWKMRANHCSHPSGVFCAGRRILYIYHYSYR